MTHAAEAKPSIVALSGGVGAARFLRGVVQVRPPSALTAIVNTGDDSVFYDVQVCPDLDTISYTLSGQVDPKLGYGLAGDSFRIADRLGALGHPSWFRLGDRDYANCLHRSLQLREGVSLEAITAELCRDLGLELRLLPMSEDPCPTYIDLEDGRHLHFEEYLIRERSPGGVSGIDLDAARRAKPLPAALEALHGAAAILICPSNPAVSIGPILALSGVREAIAESGAPVVAVSPIIGGAPVKGPAHKLLPALGAEVSALGVAKLYRGIATGFVVDAVDAASVPAIEALGMRAVACDTLMSKPGVAAALAATALSLAEELASGPLGDVS